MGNGWESAVVKLAIIIVCESQGSVQGVLWRVTVEVSECFCYLLRIHRRRPPSYKMRILEVYSPF